MAERKYWLLKSEPECYSIEDMERDGRTNWDGIRNYQARNFMRDDMMPGDLAFFYHSNAKPPGIAGIVEIVRPGYPDQTQFDVHDKHYDPKATPDEPRWIMVDVEFRKKFDEMFSLTDLKKTEGLEEMMVTRRGSRLSVQPVAPEEWARVMEILGVQTS